MKKFISRNDLHAEEIKQVNQDIADLKDTTQDTQYLSSAIKILNEIDYQYFSPLIQKVRSTFELHKYYLDVDKSKGLVNSEVPNILDSYLQELLVLQKEETSIPDHPYPDLTIQYFREKQQRLKQMELEYSQELAKLVPIWQASNDREIKSRFDPQVLAGLLKQNEDYDTNAILKLTHDLMQKELTVAHEQKNCYVIKFKWFFVVAFLCTMTIVGAFLSLFFI